MMIKEVISKEIYDLQEYQVLERFDCSLNFFFCQSPIFSKTEKESFYVRI